MPMNNYVKAVVKGLRWVFFDLELLNALDRVYRRDIAQKQGSAREERRPKVLSSSELSLNPSRIAPVTSTSGSTEPPRKKRKKYQVLPPSSTPSQSNDNKDVDFSVDDVNTGRLQEEAVIPIPKDFPMPRWLFKSGENIPLVRALLARGASPYQPSHYPLVRASQRGDVEMVKMLLAAGAPPEMKALRWACVEEQNEVLDVFLERGIKPDGQCLSWCVEKGKTRMIDRLLKLGVVPDLKTVLGF
ncbi:hypothetical protein BGZ54_008177 [Gamsiella multidivaricata]|nr:hypothetical protein BGZ54_008177 [Gamsiella multidivaricata]